MKPIYCADSQDRIWPDDFKKGKAVWSGGKAYLTVHANRLGLRPDPAPPAYYVAMLAEEEKQEKQEKQKSPAPPQPVPPLPAFDPGLVGSTIHGPTTPVKNPLLASTVAGAVSAENEKALAA